MSGSELGVVFEFGRDFSKYDIGARLLYNLTALYFAVFKRYYICIRQGYIDSAIIHFIGLHLGFTGLFEAFFVPYSVILRNSVQTALFRCSNGRAEGAGGASDQNIFLTPGI